MQQQAAQGMNFDFKHFGYLKGHANWVTSIITSQDNNNTDIVISGSRDKTAIVWKEYTQTSTEGLAGQPQKSLEGHSHFISDLALSNDNSFLISASWDHDLRLWDLKTGQCVNRFVGHEKEVFTVAFSPDNRQILSSGADKKIKLFNTKAECKYTTDKNNHVDWVSMIRFSPQRKSVGITPYFVTVGWDGWLKVWNLNYTPRFSFKAHDNNINAVAISPLYGNLIATGGKDKKVYVWDITDLKKPKYEYEAGSTINQIAFHPLLPWIAVATENEIRIWSMSDDLKAKEPFTRVNQTVDVTVNGKITKRVYGCTSLAFSTNAEKLYGGFTDGNISVWEIILLKD